MPSAELRIGVLLARHLHVDADPVGVFAHDLAHRLLPAPLHPEPDEALVVPPRKLEEEVFLRPEVVGSLVAVVAVRKVIPLRLASVGILAFATPLWVLPFQPPWQVVFAALFITMLFAPLVNGPIMAVLTKRTPADLRAKVLTAVVSVNTVAAPLGFIVAGQVLEHWGVVSLLPRSCSG